MVVAVAAQATIAVESGPRWRSPIRDCPSGGPTRARDPPVRSPVKTWRLFFSATAGSRATRATKEGLVEEVQRHAWKAHRMTLSHYEALVLVLWAELGASLPIATARTTTARKRKGEA
jgi:hypothetical protein